MENIKRLREKFTNTLDNISLIEQYETEFSNIFVAQKNR